MNGAWRLTVGIIALFGLSGLGTYAIRTAAQGFAFSQEPEEERSTVTARFLDQIAEKNGNQQPAKQNPAASQTNLNALNLAIERYRKLAEGEEKKSAREELRKTLESAFAVDMESRKAQAEEIERRLTKLRAQFESREKLKDAIIELQLQSIEEEQAVVNDAAFLEKLFNPLASRRSVSRDSSRQNIDPALENYYNAAAKAAVPSFTLRDTPQKYPLDLLKKNSPHVVEDLTKMGHFLESPDGKHYAYVDANHPGGPSYVNVVDSASGKAIAIAPVAGVAGELVFNDAGVCTKEYGKQVLRVPLGDFKAEPEASVTVRDNLRSSSSDAAFGEYTALRDRFNRAKVVAESKKEHWKTLVDEFKKSDATTTPEVIKSRQPAVWKDVEAAIADLEDAKRLLEVRVKLLKLDLEAAKSTHAVAAAELNKALEINRVRSNAVNRIEVQRLEMSAQKAQILVERAATLLDLFQSMVQDLESGREEARRR
jgi:hypothetical protein